MVNKADGALQRLGEVFSPALIKVATAAAISRTCCKSRKTASQIARDVFSSHKLSFFFFFFLREYMLATEHLGIYETSP